MSTIIEPEQANQELEPDPASRLKVWLWGIGGVLVVIGVVGLVDRFINAHSNANYGSLVPWGLWISLYIYLIGLSAGAFLISSLVYGFNVKRFESIGRVSIFTALVTLGAALLAVWLDIGHMWRFANVYIYPNFGSPMAWMIWLYTTYFVLLLFECWFLLRRDFVTGGRGQDKKAKLYRILALGSKEDSDASETRDRAKVRVLAIIGIPIAIMFHGGVGTLFGVVLARPAWNTGLFPLMFLLSALVSGGALLLFVSAIFQGGWRRHSDTIVALGRLVLGLLLLDVLFQFSEFLITNYNQAHGWESMAMILFGPYWYVFWGWQIILGTIVPIFILVWKKTSIDAKWVAAAGLLIASGFFAVRLNIVIPALSVGEVDGIVEAVNSERVTTDYVPSITEWLVTAGIFGLLMIGFGIGEKLLPREAERV
ncbi:MAG: NrfD/PsrC family molybdoenzyme membrane anchor subunit [Candidatus Nanopelagicales bacterium]|nr:NrfD/PsrC family molybdoenzyme membrane anchor subunit [Candidatus Nanopelagicales bacterium]